MTIPDYYKILGISRDALPSEIKKAYKEKARLYHPDVFKNEHAVEIFQLVNMAYHTLIDPVLRKKYDLILKYPESFGSKTDARFRHPADIRYYERSEHKPPVYPKHYARNIRRLNRFMLYSIIGILGFGIIMGIIDLIVNFEFSGILISLGILAILLLGVNIIKL